MKRHTVLAAVAAPLLALSFAVAAQAATSDDSTDNPADAVVPSDSATPVAPEATTDPAVGPAELPEPTPDPSPTASALPEGATEPDVAETPLPEPVAPERSTSQAPAAPDLHLADVLISFAATDVVPGAVVVSGYLTGVETGGVCTLTLTRGAETFVVEGAAEPDATTTVCGGLTMSTAGLTRGAWTVTLSYLSDTQSGISSSSNVTVA